MGDISNNQECEDGDEFEIKEVSLDRNHARVTSDDDGLAWLMFGMCSGFECQTELYNTYFRTNFNR